MQYDLGWFKNLGKFLDCVDCQWTLFFSVWGCNLLWVNIIFYRRSLVKLLSRYRVNFTLRLPIEMIFISICFSKKVLDVEYNHITKLQRLRCKKFLRLLHEKVLRKVVSFFNQTVWSILRSVIGIVLKTWF